MKEPTVKLFADTSISGPVSPDVEAGRTFLVASVISGRNRSITDIVSRSSTWKKLTLATVVPLFAAVSLMGCQSAEDQALAAEAAKTKTSETSTPKSNWPKMMTIPAGTTLLVSLNSTLRTDREKTGDNFTARLYDAVRVDQMTVLPSGTEVRGRLIQVEEPHRTAGKAAMTLAFDQIVDPSGKLHSISTSPIVLVGEGDKISDEEKVAAGAVIGGVIGALTSSQQRTKGAAVGAAAGAAAGGAIALATKGKQIELPAGQHFALDLDESLRVSVTQLTANR